MNILAPGKQVNLTKKELDMLVRLIKDDPIPVTIGLTLKQIKEHLAVKLLKKFSPKDYESFIQYEQERREKYGKTLEHLVTEKMKEQRGK